MVAKLSKLLRRAVGQQDNGRTDKKLGAAADRLIVGMRNYHRDVRSLAFSVFTQSERVDRPW
jgi:hypothetical protein